MLLEQMAREGAPEDAPFELSCREMVQLLEHIDTLGAGLDLEAGDYCRVCGCTQNNACEQGCAWSEEGLCTACAEVLDAEEQARLGPCPSCDGSGDRGQPEPWCATCDGTGKAPATAPASEPEVLRWMRSAIADGSYRDPATGEPEFTQLAEAAAEHFLHDDWLDDEQHPVWEWAIQAFGDEEIEDDEDLGEVAGG